MTRHPSLRLLLVLQILLAVATGVAIALAAGPAEGLVAFAVVAGFAVGLHVLRERSETAEVLSGVGDERIRSLSLTAAAWTAYVMALILIGWWLVSLAVGDNNETVNILCGIFGVTWLACAVLARVRQA